MVSDEENPLFGAEGEEPILPYGTVDELIELIKNAVEPTFWEETEGADIRGSGEHALVVKATNEVQEKVDRFLRDLRGFAGIVVTVETRFLEVGDYFLRDVGVDFRGLGGQTPGPLVNLDDVTNGLEDNSSAGYDNGGSGLTTGAALNPSSGMYFDDGGDGDFRGRTENIFDNSLGNVLSALGGASFTFSLPRRHGLQRRAAGRREERQGASAHRPHDHGLQHAACEPDRRQPAVLHPGLRRRGRPDLVHRGPDRRHHPGRPDPRRAPDGLQRPPLHHARAAAHPGRT